MTGDCRTPFVAPSRSQLSCIRLLALSLLCVVCRGALQPPPVPRRTLLRGTAGALASIPFAAAAVPVRRFGAGRQSPNSVADEATKLVWTPRAEVGEASRRERDRGACQQEETRHSSSVAHCFTHLGHVKSARRRGGNKRVLNNWQV